MTVLRPVQRMRCVELMLWLMLWLMLILLRCHWLPLLLERVLLVLLLLLLLQHHRVVLLLGLVRMV